MLHNLRDSLRAWGSVAHDLSVAQARWEVDTARLIFARRRAALLVVLAPVIVVLVLQAAVAGDMLPEQVPILGGSKALMPLFADTKMLVGSVLVGLCAGLITGVIGAGGGYILTPALMSFGVRGIMAVGTDQFHIFAKAIIGATVHRRLGNVNARLAAWFVVGSVVGVTIGGKLSRAIFMHSPALSDAVISSVYVVVLGLLGVYALADWFRLRRSDRAADSRRQATTGLARRLQALSVRPQVTFDESIVPGGRSIPVYPLIVCGFIVGFVAAIMGVGGGFLTFPMFVYGLGVSTFTTVGTDILQLIFTTSYSSIFQYAIYGFVFYTLSVGMLVGSLAGVQIGAMVTTVIKGSQIRALYALTILAGLCNRLFALPRKLADLGYISLPRNVTVPLETIGTVAFFLVIGVFAVWTLAAFFRHVVAARRDAEGEQRPAAGPVVAPRQLRRGALGIVALAAALVLVFLPLIDGQSALVWADTLFNALAKNSSDHIAEARSRAQGYAGLEIDISVKPEDVVDEGRVAQLVSAAGLRGQVTDDGRVRIVGDLGRLSREAVADAELAFNNEPDRLSARRDMPPNEVIYCWWIIFDGLTRRYVQENRGLDANFTKFVSAKVLEPAYNFRGIEPRTMRQCIVPLLLLLAAYLGFTLWYGFSTLHLFEGFGLRTVERTDKQEA